VAGVEFPYWILPVGLPAVGWTTKARVIGVGCLLGMALFDPARLRSLRPSLFDGVAVGWMVLPLAADLANGRSFGQGLADLAYQAMAWGVPYLAGRAYFSDSAGLLLFARALVLGGLAVLPAFVVEFVLGPVLYSTAFGFHPFREQGAERYFGYRPLLFFEDGNQFGMFMASAALAAVWLWRTGRLAPAWKVPGTAVVVLLLIACLMSQSAGAIVLLAVALVGLEGLSRLDRRWPALVVVGLGLLLVGARALNLFDAKALAESTSAGRAVIAGLKSTDRASFGWRLRVEERGARIALQKPILGWGRPDWWRAGEQRTRPWGLFALVLGQYGLVGWGMLGLLLLGPPLAVLALGPPGRWAMPGFSPAAGLAAVLAINGADAFLNPAYLVFLIAAAPGVLAAASGRLAVATEPSPSGGSDDLRDLLGSLGGSRPGRGGAA
jgi:hypothetical protein